jgi:pyruvate,water dikinase
LILLKALSSLFSEKEERTVTINPTPTLENLGGKGLQLTQLREICSVPDFFVICFSSDSETEYTEIKEQILNYFDDFGGGLVAVRSSATLEDSSKASFAGMFETELNVTRGTLLAAIAAVLKSARDSRVIEYCKINQMDFTSILMRIVVQKMVNSRVSGVCLTRESQDSNNMLIESCYGLGEALVSGIVTPDTYRVDRDSFECISQSIGFQKIMFDSTVTHTPVPVPFHRRNAKKLTVAEIKEVAQMCMSIERSLDYYSADIEWAYENRSLKLLQARPFVGVQ